MIVWFIYNPSLWSQAENKSGPGPPTEKIPLITKRKHKPVQDQGQHREANNNIRKKADTYDTEVIADQDQINVN